MGTWGVGNFDNDGAGDHVDMIIGQLEATIRDCLADEFKVMLDEDGESVLMPSVEILAVLCEYCKATPPTVEVIQGWQQRYLQVYDQQIDELVLDPKSGFKEQRRRVIVDTFNRLE